MAILLLDGNPKIGEPLTEAWQRGLQSEGWQAYRAKYSQPILAYGCEATPFGPEGSSVRRILSAIYSPRPAGRWRSGKIECAVSESTSLASLVYLRDFAGVLLQLN